MSTMRNGLIIEVERNGKVYSLSTPSTTNMIELLDVVREMMDQCLETVDNLEKQINDLLEKSKDSKNKVPDANGRLEKIAEVEKELIAKAK